MDKSANNVIKLMDTLLGRCPEGVSHTDEPYEEYLANAAPSHEELTRQAEDAALPTFGIAIIGEGDEEELKRTAASLCVQSHPRYRLLSDPREGDSDYILYMWAGDVLSPNALYEFAAAAAEGHDLIYCDEDSFTDGRRREPVFKPEPDRFTEMSYDMLCCGVAVSRGLFNAVGGMTGGDGNGRYEYNLKCLMSCASPKHIPKVLYTSYKPVYADEGARLAVQEHACKDEAVLPGRFRGSFIVERRLKKCSAAVIIRCRNGCDRLMTLLNSIDRAARGEGVRIMIADQGSADRRTKNYYDILARNGAAEILTIGDVGAAKLLNRAAAEAGQDALIFLDSGVEVLSVNWIEGLLSQAMRKGVGAVAPRLIDQRGRLLHTGTVIGIGGWQGSAYAGEENGAKTARKRRFIEAVRAVSGASMTAMAISAKTFFSAGGFDESFEEAGADTQLSIRLARRGYVSLYTPAVTLRYDGAIPSVADAPERQKQRCYDAMRELLLNGDPHYSPNYSYASPVPRVSPSPEPAIRLNGMYNGR